MFHILCFIKTNIHHASIDVHKFINSSKYSYISIHGHGLIMLYDIHMHLDFFNIITNDSSEYIATTLILVMKSKTYYMCVWSSFMFNFYIRKQTSNYNSTF